MKDWHDKLQVLEELQAKKISNNEKQALYEAIKFIRYWLGKVNVE